MTTSINKGMRDKHLIEEEPYEVKVSSTVLKTSMSGDTHAEFNQRRLFKKQFGSKNWHKAREKVARLHEHIYNTRKNFHYQVAHHLCDQANIIFAEDLNLKAMSRGMLCKHTLDAGFGGFLEILKHVAWKRDVYFEKVDANLTSQTCPNCGVVTGKKNLSQRVHECSHCGFITDRDVAAAMVVEQRGLAALGLGVKLPVEDEVIGGVLKKRMRPRAVAR